MTPGIAALRDDIAAHRYGPAYTAKMMHPIPEARVVDRERFILERCKGRVVLDVGASGLMHAAIVAVAGACFGIDREAGEGVAGVDLDDPAAAWPPCPGVEVIICGEVIEHLSNPGQFLARLRRTFPGVPVIVTVPNAFTEAGAAHVRRGSENVNIDHVAWYSPRTLQTLLGRAGYEVREWYWYGGKPRVSEGLIAVAG